MDKKETYSYKDSGNVQRVIELSDNDFEFVQKEKSIHDVNKTNNIHERCFQKILQK